MSSCDFTKCLRCVYTWLVFVVISVVHFTTSSCAFGCVCCCAMQRMQNRRGSQHCVMNVMLVFWRHTLIYIVSHLLVQSGMKPGSSLILLVTSSDMCQVKTLPYYSVFIMGLSSNQWYCVHLLTMTCIATIWNLHMYMYSTRSRLMFSLEQYCLW